MAHLLFAEAEKQQNSRLGINFRITENEGFAINFHVLSETVYPENNGLMISFVQGEKSDLTHNVKVIDTIDEKIQLIRIALMTELGQLPRRDTFGSSLSRQRHQDIHDTKNLAVIQSTTEGIVSRFLNNPSVTVKPARGVGNLYFHNVEIRIYEDNMQIFKFHI